MSIPYLSVLKNKAFRNLWLAQITSQVSLNMLNFVLALRVYHLTESNTAVSSMLLTFSIPAIFMGVLAGGIVDHFDKRMVLLSCNISRVVLFLLFFIFPDRLIVLYCLSILMSLVTQLFIPAEGPAIALVVSRDYLLRANSLFTISFFLSTFVGFLLAGPLIHIVGYEFSHLVMGILMVAATYFVYILPPFRPLRSHPSSRIELKEAMRTISDGIHFIMQHPRVRQSLILLTVSQALISSLAVLAPGFSDKLLSIHLEDASLYVMGPSAVGLIAGAFVVGILGERYLKGALIEVGLLFAGLILVILPITTSSWHPDISWVHSIYSSMLLLFFLGFFNSWINVPASTILQQDSHETMMGRVYGVLTSLTGAGSLLPVIISGIVADIWGVGSAIASLGALLLLGLILYRFLLRSSHSMV